MWMVKNRKRTKNRKWTQWKLENRMTFYLEIMPVFRSNCRGQRHRRSYHRTSLVCHYASLGSFHWTRSAYEAWSPSTFRASRCDKKWSSWSLSIAHNAEHNATVVCKRKLLPIKRQEKRQAEGNYARYACQSCKCCLFTCLMRPKLCLDVFQRQLNSYVLVYVSNA